MATRPAEIATDLRPKTGFQLFMVRFKRNWMLHLMMVLPMFYYFLFEALPIYGVQIAFRDYRPRQGIFGSEWVGLDNFMEFFRYRNWGQITWNTIAISLYQIVAGFPIPIILALIIHINENKLLKKFTQNLSYIPHFISVVVLVGILDSIFSPLSGIVALVQQAFGIYSTTDIRTSEEAFRHLYVWSGIWASMGWGAIMYVSALSGVSTELHEAAKIDGASRLKRVMCVDLPAIAPTIAIMLILRFSSVMSVGYQKVYLMQHSLNLDVSEVISTYTFKRGLGDNKLSYSSAVGLMNSVINTTLMVTVNKVANVLSDGEAGLF